MSYATLVFVTHGIGSRVGAVALVHAICARRIVIDRCFFDSSIFCKVSPDMLKSISEACYAD
jgi:hypothetical protein